MSHLHQEMDRSESGPSPTPNPSSVVGKSAPLEPTTGSGPAVSAEMVTLPGQTHLSTALRGFDRDEVRTLLTDAADDYEAALREVDRLRQDFQKAESQLGEHRDREINLRNTLLTAQKVARSASRASRRRRGDTAISEWQNCTCAAIVRAVDDGGEIVQFCNCY